MARLETLKVQQRAQSEVRLLGKAREPLLILDDAVVDAAPAMADYAATSCKFEPVASGSYPGVRAPAPAAFAELVREAVAPAAARVFASGPAILTLLAANFSLVTTHASQLTPLQRLPHIDAASPGLIAVLLYLCGPELGGTGFFRHRATQLEGARSEAQSRLLMRAITHDISAYGAPPAQFAHAMTPYFEQIDYVPARFGRVIAYRGSSLHSGVMPETFAYSADPRAGRLTLNIFFDLRMVQNRRPQVEPGRTCPG